MYLYTTVTNQTLRKTNSSKESQKCARFPEIIVRGSNIHGYKDFFMFISTKNYVQRISLLHVTHMEILYVLHSWKPDYT